MKLTTEIDNRMIFFKAIIVTGVLSASVEATRSKMSSRAVGDNVNTNYFPDKGIPASILVEIRSLDGHLKCMPKLLCNIYQDDSITRRLRFLNTTELAVSYLKLLKAVHYVSPSTTTTMAPYQVKRPIIQIIETPLGIIKSTYSGRKDHNNPFDDLEDYPDYFRSPLSDDYAYADESFDYESKSRGANNDRAYHREKLEISQMMQDLVDEDKMEAKENDNNDNPSSASGGSLTTSLLSSFLPFVGSRSGFKRSIDTRGVTRFRDSNRRIPNSRDRRRRKQLNNQSGVPKDPFWKAVNTWRKLKRRSQCQDMYKTCPFEAWEIVRMLDLVKGQSKILSAYLKLTVDKVKPRKSRH